MRCCPRTVARLARAFVVAAGALLGGCGGDELPAGTERIGNRSSELLVQNTTLWPTPSAIPVCWETAGFAKEKGWVKSALQASWEAAAPAIKFKGFADCAASAKGIHIQVATVAEGPNVVSFGKELDGVANGMTLDFQFTDGTFPPCATSEAMRERCIRAIATHEFGHALGFLHEHERDDTPASCPDKQTFPADPTVQTLGEWDLMSIMNYCYPDRANVFPTQLSPNDVKGVLKMYPSPKAGESSTSSTDTDTGAEDEDSAEDEDGTSSPRKKNPVIASTGCSATGGPIDGSAAVLALVALAGLGSRRARRRRS